MKIYNVCIIFLVTLFISACSDDDNSFYNKKGYKSVTLYVPDSSDTSYSEDDNYIGETHIYSFLINFIDQQGNVIQSKTINREIEEESDWSYLTDPSKGLRIPYLTENIYKIHIYGNPGNALKENKISTRLADQQGDAILYYGEIDLFSSSIEKNGVTEVTLSPIVSELRIKDISFLNSDDKVTVKGIYMNNFYNNYNGELAENLLLNKTFYQHIHNGQWIFNNPQVNATRFASYTNYQNEEYGDLPVGENTEYSFNFFPGDKIPYLHIELEYETEGISNGRFANIKKYVRKDGKEMTAEDFEAGKSYNIHITLIPILSDDPDAAYTIETYVEVRPLIKERITMIFQSGDK